MEGEEGKKEEVLDTHHALQLYTLHPTHLSPPPHTHTHTLTYPPILYSPQHFGHWVILLAKIL
jgi:hypothetical protein